MAAQAELSHLPKADGSATFAYSGYTVTAVVNGPLEAQRRDENPFEALVDVNVRPAAGVGGTAERQLESILQSTLRQIIPIRNFPRCVIQVTLQVMETPENAYINTKLAQAKLNLALIPALLHAAVLGLLTAAIPLTSVATATLLAVANGDSDEIIVDPSPVEVSKARSTHVLGFTVDEKLLLVESEGSFTVDEWDKVLQTGQRLCCRPQESALDTVMGGDVLESQSIQSFIRSVLENKAAHDLQWK